MKRFKYLIYIAVVFIGAIGLASCDDNNEVGGGDEASRTILVYMVANNSLGTAGFDNSDIEEMKVAASNRGFNGGRLLIYHAPRSGEAPQLKEVTATGEVVTLKEYSSAVSSVEASRMQQVIDDAKVIAPANDYGLILWSHANGWLQTGIEDRSIVNTPEPTAFGEDAGKHMNVTTLAGILKDENFSFIYFDCCYMASVEVVYELRNTTPYIIASATEIPADGMPYSENLPCLFADTPDLRQACVNTYDYYNSRNDETRSCTISLIDTGHLDELASVTKAIYASGVTKPENYTPQKFMLESICYLYDFEHYIKAVSTDEGMTDRWSEALSKTVLYKANTPYMWNSLKIKAHCGLSTFIVDQESDADTKGYRQLQWWSDVVGAKFNQ